MPQSRSWFEIRNAVGVTDIYLYDEIGGFGISAASFVDALNAIKTKAINLFVNSPGGDVADGTAIFNALKRHSAAVHAIVDGIAASAASFIVQAADKISMGTGSVMVIHDAHGLALGNAATMTEMAATLGMLSDNIAQMYADRAGGTPEEWRTRMIEETWYTAQGAVDAKLADEVVGATKAQNLLSGRVFNLSKFRNVPEWVPNQPDPVEIDPPAPQIAPITLAEARKWPLLVHHADTGAVDADRLAVAMTRARNTEITVANRDEAIRHLEGHARERGSKAA